MSRQRSALAAIGQIYDACLEPDGWERALGGVSEFVGVGRAMMGFSDRQQGQGTIFYLHGVDGDLVQQRWLGDYAGFDPWLASGVSLTVGDVKTGSEAIAHDQLRRLGIYNDVLTPLGIDDVLCSAIAMSGSRMALFNLYRSRNEGLFQPRQVAQLKILAPHLVRAAEVHAVLRRHASLTGAWQTTVDAMPWGVFVCGPRGHLRWHNAAAEELLRGGWLRLIGRRVRALDIHDDARLDAAMARAARVGSSLRLGTLSSAACLFCTLVPVEQPRVASALGLSAEPQVLLFVNRAAAPPVVAESAVAAALGLTPAEARLAVALAGGTDLEQYAEQCELSLHTVRNQLKRALSKSGSRRQSDLIRRVLTMSFPS